MPCFRNWSMWMARWLHSSKFHIVKMHFNLWRISYIAINTYMQQASLHMFDCKTALYNILIILLRIYPSVIFHSLSCFSFMQCILSGLYNIPELPWWLRGIESSCQFRRCQFNPCFRKIPCRRKWQPTPVFLSGKPHE